MADEVIQSGDEFAAAQAAMLQPVSDPGEATPADTPPAPVPNRGSDGKFVKQQDETPVEEEEDDDQPEAEIDQEGEEAGEDQEADGEDDGEEGDESGEEVLDLDDDVVIEVAVDGEVKEVTLADLKKNFSGTQYIEKNIQQAVEKRKEVEALSQNLYQNNTVLIDRLKRIDSMLGEAMQPQIDWERLKQEDPQEYIIRREELREAQEKQREVQAEIQRKQQENEQLQAEALKRYTEDQAQRLIKAEPAFGDKEKAKGLMKGIAQTANEYGFTPQELGTVTDHRMILVLHDLAKLRKVTGEREKAEAEARDTPKTRKRIKLKNAARKSQRSQSQKRQQANLQRARETGRPEDVAALLVQPSRT